MNKYSYTIFIGVKQKELAVPVIQNIQHLNFKIIIGDKIKCFSELVNNCIKLCSSEIFIFLSHKVVPTESDIMRLCKLIDTGYGYVGLYRFACFALHKDAIKRVGYFDENFISGGCEDDDYKLRFQQANIAIYEDHSVVYKSTPTTFENITARKHFAEKYRINCNKKIILKLIRDECDFTVNVDRFLKFDSSVFIQNLGTVYGRLNLNLFNITEAEEDFEEDAGEYALNLILNKI